MANESQRGVTEDCITQNSSLLTCSRVCFCPAVQGYSLVAVAIVLSVVGSVANTLACVTILRSPSLRKRQHYLIVNLAFGDLLLTAIGMPLYAVCIMGEIESSCVDIISRVKGFNLNTSVLVSLLTLCGISIERLVVIVWPFKYRSIITKQRICIGIAIFWIISIVYGIVIAKDVHVHSVLAYSVFTVASLTGMTLCYIIIVVCYVIILIKSIRMTYNRRNLAPNQQDKTDRRVAMTVAVVISLFTITWSPFVFFRFFAGNGGQIWYKVSELLALSSSAFNSMIYFYRSEEYRAALKQLVCGPVRVHVASGGHSQRTTLNLELHTKKPVFLPTP